MSDVSQQESLLTREHLQSILNIEKGFLSNGESCVPKVLVMLHSGETGIVTIPELGSDSNEKRLMFNALGQKLRAEKGSIKEAVFIAESWMVNASAPDSNKYAPSEHPAREEAIVVVGRNEDKSYSLIAIQPFGRNKKDKPVWREPIISISGEGGYSYEGILDDFFTGVAQVTVPEMKA
ncbi:MAG: hypothetical protein R2932_28870 [Caldilineaceae bacterium]